MAMLAAPRRKQKVINLRAKNNAWSNDTNKFGQRMLEKMGWSSGKGLGANEDGIVEHVVARYKNDEKGLGFEDRNDQWTKHEDDFNSLLSNLSNASNEDRKLHSGVSLEVKSKKSKARVHYHKFTRGKDLTRYSEKDLANIFGKRSLKNKDEHEHEHKHDKEKVPESELKFCEKGSMEDYFKNKMAVYKSKMLDPQLDIQSEGADYMFKGFSISEENVSTGSAQESLISEKSKTYDENRLLKAKGQSYDSEDQTQLVRKKKKKSKTRNSDPQMTGEEKLFTDENEITCQEQNFDINSKPVKKSKRKSETQNDCTKDIKCKKNLNNTENLELFQNSQEDVKPKKKKKRKNKEFQ